MLCGYEVREFGLNWGKIIISTSTSEVVLNIFVLCGLRERNYSHSSHRCVVLNLHVRRKKTHYYIGIGKQRFENYLSHVYNGLKEAINLSELSEPEI